MSSLILRGDTTLDGSLSQVLRLEAVVTAAGPRAMLCMVRDGVPLGTLSPETEYSRTEQHI